MKGQPHPCYCVLRPGHSASADLTARLTSRVIDRLGKPLKPKTIEFVRDLPKTRNAKVMRRVIRSTYLGEDPGDISSLENPQAVDEIRLARRT
jgi:acetyl-CoA synthetase